MLLGNLKVNEIEKRLGIEFPKNIGSISLGESFKEKYGKEIGVNPGKPSNELNTYVLENYGIKWVLDEHYMSSGFFLILPE